MKPTLQLKQGLQLNLTPQLQQAIRLLQLSSIELQQEVQQLLESNPLLEKDETDNYDNTDYAQPVTAEVRQDELDTEIDWENDTVLQEELPVDSKWDDMFISKNSASFNDDADDSYENKTADAETLVDSLYWQLAMTTLVDSDRLIAAIIIDAVKPNGFLCTSAQELYQSSFTDSDIEFEEFEAVRALIHTFEPFGVGCESLAEFLTLQLQRMPATTAFVEEAQLLIRHHLPSITIHDYATLKKRTKLDEQTIKNALLLIQGLLSQPAQEAIYEKTEYITPDVYVRKKNNQWEVELSRDCDIKLRINSDYAALATHATSTEDSVYIRNNLQEAKWFIKSLQTRNDTLLKVATHIVKHQRGFLEYGEQAMKPLILQDIAKEADVHESSVSRATTRKYLHTPRGIYELKYFFSSGVSTDAGGECSSVAIKSMIKTFISEENLAKPLSDSKLEQLLTAQGINIARRTIAKYREELLIPPSNERKRIV